uniref:EGF-like domain-containing protein n=1 Tax=Globisporangium ultimum (strain ATCC 200006 / CBS 805.95 / DAOM BR144) TaxID=431595 RepID=K3W511_GLOUD
MCTAEGDVVEVDGSSYNCTKDDVLTLAKKEFIISVLLKGIRDYFESALSVQSVIGNLIINGLYCNSDATWACCSDAIPQSFRTIGVSNADYVLHVTARPTTGATIAWALPCNIDQYGRPISGQANFGPARLDPSTPVSRDEQIGTGIHEMTHALVFSRNRFSDFRQPLNGALWGYSNVVSQKKGRGGITVSKIVTPNVVKQIKQQFNCFNWVDPGLELENGDKGSADFSSHWEKRMVMNEYMSATSSYDPVYSALTLALFEDSGWYQVSYKRAQILPWGYMEGCGLAQSVCSEWNSRYICKDTTQLACTADYNSKGYCNVASYTSSIPSGFQYFADPNFGGRDAYADYCPFYRAYSNGDCRGIGRIATTSNADSWMEEVGLSSKCFMSSLSKKSASSTPALRTTCYRVTGCTTTSLMLSIGGKDVACPLEGGDISCNPGYEGADCSGISCPKYNGVGYSGVTCSIKNVPTVIELTEGGGPVTDVVTNKEYKFYKAKLTSSSYDTTFVVEYDAKTGLDIDLYGSFDDPFPTSLSSKSSLFTSNVGSGSRDEINLCGSLGVFPRGLNDTFRYCPRATSSYLLETPGYFYLSVLGYSGGSYTLRIETDKCKNVTCSNHGTCGIRSEVRPGLRRPWNVQFADYQWQN